MGFCDWEARKILGGVPRWLKYIGSHTASVQCLGHPHSRSSVCSLQDSAYYGLKAYVLLIRGNKTDSLYGTQGRVVLEPITKKGGWNDVNGPIGTKHAIGIFIPLRKAERMV